MLAFIRNVMLLLAALYCFNCCGKAFVDWFEAKESEGYRGRWISQMMNNY